ncbi:hypothetical protein GCM10009865_04380 [Aeromicrobium ponti]|uniref:Uncharacterized protein n=1 Tax=Cytobacillus oceanisediminis TaxID=665099 RepID=A0A562K629_9BACI|nr:hypothetical protein [Cytobacillus oceanisediminis]TWH90898.1 hypothetical protein IQ19_00348 [Cytobacillus oceanisediminis]
MRGADHDGEVYYGETHFIVEGNVLMSKKEFLLDQLAVCRNEDSWIQPLRTALKGLSLEDA